MSDTSKLSIWSVWGLLGITALLGNAIWRLSLPAAETLRSDLTTVQWVVLVIVVGIFAYSEGYKGFQKAFSPRVAARAMHAHTRGWMAKLLAPLFCMALFDATKKRKIVSWVLVTVIVGLIVAVRLLAAPWRGIVDAGVVVGLSWGLVATWVFFVRAAASGTDRDPEFP